MGMIDSYRPKQTFKCIVCGTELKDWQGTDADCMLLYWEEGKAHPVATDFPEECFADKNEFLKSCYLPESFMIYNYDCDCPYPSELSCTCINNIWIKSLMFTGSEEDFKFKGAERKKEYKKRMKWLKQT